jgi:glucokinase
MTSAKSADSQNRDLDNILKDKMPALGIDLGGTKIGCAPVAEFKVIAEPKKVPTPKGAENIINTLVELIEEARKDHILSGVGIATAGIVNIETGEVIGSTGNLPGWAGTPIKKEIEGRTGLPVHVDNDANAAAYGEVKALGLSHKTCVVAVTLGTGIGGGIIMKGELFRGAHYAAGEIGHLRANLNNHRLCTCGLFDCWEAYGSGRGFRATAKEMLTNVTVDQTPLAALLPDPAVDKVCAAAKEGDIIAKRIVDTWHEHICAGIVTLAHTLDPDCFIISGGMAKFVDYDLLKELVIDKSLPRVGERLDIHRSSLGDDAGIIGAAQIALDQLVTI